MTSIIGLGLSIGRFRRRSLGGDGSAIEFLPGQIVDDGSPAFTEPPIVLEITDGIKFKGRKASGASGKFIYTIGLPAPGRQYTLRYDPDWSQLENGGASAMVGFGFKLGNQFRLSGLKGDGSTGLNAYEVFGGNWHETTGFSTSDGGAAANGTQGGPNWLRLITAADNATYTLQSSSDGISFVHEFTDVVPAPFGDLDEASQFGIAVFLDSGDAGPFTVEVTLWTNEVATSAAQFDVTSNVTLSNNNRTATHANTTNNSGARSSTGKNSGKWYLEFTCTDLDGAFDCVGFLTAAGTFTNMVTDGTNCIAMYRGTGNVFVNSVLAISGAGIGGAIDDGDLVQFAIDLDSEQVWVRANSGNWNGNVGTQPGGSGGVSIAAYAATTLAPAVGFGGASTQSGDNVTLNFGQSPMVNAVPSGFTAGWPA